MCRFCENFVSTYKNPRNGTCHGAARIILRIKKNHETARALVSRCAVMFSHEIFSTNRHKLSNARKPSAARVCVSLRGLFCFNFEAPCRFLILIISLIRENWALNVGKNNERPWLENAKTEKQQLQIDFGRDFRGSCHFVNSATICHKSLPSKF